MARHRAHLIFFFKLWLVPQKNRKCLTSTDFFQIFFFMVLLHFFPRNITRTICWDNISHQLKKKHEPSPNLSDNLLDFLLSFLLTAMFSD